jgi:phosphate transport system substrate-binding protein
MKVSATLTVTAIVALCAAPALARDQIRIVGSSTVFPFTTAVAEAFGAASGNPVPVVESTGTGGGMKLFCEGVGENTPDMTNASRRIKPSEFEACVAAGVTDIIEVKLGFDGIAIAGSKEGPSFDLTLANLCVALVKGAGEPATWAEIDPSLPDLAIEVLGPPPSSGTRDSFEELALTPGCEDAGLTIEEVEVRDDGVWIDSGENDNLIVSKLEGNPDALGVFGYSFLEENSDALQSAVVEGVEAGYDAIASGEYPIARTMYLYAKAAHLSEVTGAAEFLAAYTSAEASGPDGYLVEKGLIALPDDVFAANAKAVSEGVLLQASDLE